MAREKILRIALILGSIALVFVIVEKLWLFGQTFSGLVSVLAGAWFLALVLRPFIHLLRSLSLPGPFVRLAQRRLGSRAALRLARARIPAPVAVAAVYTTALVLVIGTVTVGVATLIQQINSFSAQLPEISTRLPGQISLLWIEFSRQFGFDPAAINQILSPEEIAAQIRQAIGSVVSQALSLAAGTANLVWQVFLMLILSLFITTEGRLLRRQFSLLVPKAWHETVRAGAGAMERSFDGYLRGTLFGAVIRGAVAFLVLSLFQVNFSIVIALQYAILSLIPLLGSPVGILVAAIITLVFRPEAALLVSIILVVADQIVAYGVLPRVLHYTVGVPGLVGLIGVTMGVQLFGFWGLLFSIPLIGALYALLFEFYLPRQQAAEMRELAGRAAPSEDEPAPAEQAEAAGASDPRPPAGATIQSTRTAP